MLFLPETYIKHFLSKFDYINIKVENDLPSEPELESFIHLKTDVNLEAFFYSILNYFVNMEVVNKELLEVKFDELLLNVFTQPTYSELSAHLLSLANDNRVNMRQVMEENFASSLKLSEYAELCNMSLSTFKRKFPKTYNTTPGKWLLNRKLQRAKKLLVFNQKPPLFILKSIIYLDS